MLFAPLLGQEALRSRVDGGVLIVEAARSPTGPYAVYQTIGALRLALNRLPCRTKPLEYNTCTIGGFVVQSRHTVFVHKEVKLPEARWLR